MAKPIGWCGSEGLDLSASAWGTMGVVVHSGQRDPAFLKILEASGSGVAQRSCLHRGLGCGVAAWVWLCSAVFLSGETSLALSLIQGPSLRPILEASLFISPRYLQIPFVIPRWLQLVLSFGLGCLPHTQSLESFSILLSAVSTFSCLCPRQSSS